MPPTLVYLIPEDFWGPVFVFFDQLDGQELQADPLGRSVMVPGNGVVKIKEPVRTAVGDNVPPDHRAEQWVILTKDGRRLVLKMFLGSYRSEVSNNSTWVESYLDEKNQIHQFNSEPEKRGYFYYLTQSQKKQKMIFGRDGCVQQFLPVGKNLECGRFLVLSPDQQITFPKSAWDDFLGNKSTVPELVRQADERLAERRKTDQQIGN